MALPEPIYPLAGKRVWITGHRGLVGSALLRRLKNAGCECLTAGREEADLRVPSQTRAWMEEKRPQAIFVAAGTVGGIMANSTRPAEFIYDNMMIAANVIEASRHLEVEKLIFLGSSCIYPKAAPQPMAENALLTGPLEPTNQWYAIAKIAGIKLCQAYRKQYGCDYISAQPTNLYGPEDNFDLQSSHVLPALMVKAHQAKAAGAEALTIWGTGNPLREFLHVDDLADALIFLMERYSGDVPVNVGSGREISIRELAETLCRAVGFTGRLAFDADKPDGPPRKLVDASFINNLGWRPAIDLERGIRDTYAWFLNHQA